MPRLPDFGDAPSGSACPTPTCGGRLRVIRSRRSGVLTVRHLECDVCRLRGRSDVLSETISRRRSRNPAKLR